MKIKKAFHITPLKYPPLNTIVIAVYPEILTLSLYKPRTTSDIRFSSTGSPCVLTTQPGRGGKLVAAKSNLGGETLTSASGTGL